MNNTDTKKSTSRRDWFTGSAAILGAGAISSLVLRGQTGSTANDISILNFALRLENLESAFYNQGLAMFAPKDIANSVAVQSIGGSKIGANLYGYLGDIRTQEQAHVTTLIQSITALGGTPQPLDCYAFGFKTADDFLRIAQVLENAGVMAYDGAIASLKGATKQYILISLGRAR